MARGRFVYRGNPRLGKGQRPSRQWIPINTGFVFAGITGSTNSVLMRMEMPTDPTNLTADPPEDIIILRIVGEFEVSMAAAAAAASWTLALTVQDWTWSSSATFAADADKRLLWTRTYTATADNVAFQWLPGLGQVSGSNTVIGNSGMEEPATRLDIAPKVKLEAGKALALVAYENVDGRALTVTGRSMRLLYQKSRRR